MLDARGAHDGCHGVVMMSTMGGHDEYHGENLVPRLRSILHLLLLPDFDGIVAGTRRRNQPTNEGTSQPRLTLTLTLTLILGS